jgi:hypothetical protein
MSLSCTARGTNSGSAAGGTLTIVPSGDFARGSLAVLVIAYDNSGGSGADPYTAITDNSGYGRPWTSRLNQLRDPSSASNGCVLRIFTAPVDAPLTTGHTITVSAGTAAAFAAALWEVVPDAGYVALFALTATGSGGASTTPSDAGPTVQVDQVSIGGVAYEYGQAPETSDTDVTNGTWSTRQNANAGSTTSGMSVCTQWKLQTTTSSTQTYNPTYTNSSDWAAGLISVKQEFGGRVQSGGTVLFNDPGSA